MKSLAVEITRWFFHLLAALRLAVGIGIAVLGICILLTIFDQFGLADLIAVILFAIPLVIMLAKRKEFLQETQ